MIQAVEITNHRNESVRLELANPWEIGIAVSSIDGLGPVKGTVNITEYSSTIDGALYNSSRVPSRNIVMSLIFIDTLKSIEEVRHDTYRYFPLKERIKFLVETDKRVCETYGWVESNNPSIFDKMEGCQVSIICPNPWFYDSLKDSSVMLKSVTDMFKFSFKNNISPINQFQFRFSNNSLVNDMLQFYDSECENYINFGNIEYYREKNLLYLGEITTGVTIKIEAKGYCKNPVIKNGKTNEYMLINTDVLNTLTGNEIVAGDEIVINTEKGSKSIKLIREGEEYNILNCLNPNSDWINVVQGENLFIYTAEVGQEDIEVTVMAKIAYQGV